MKIMHVFSLFFLFLSFQTATAQKNEFKKRTLATFQNLDSMLIVAEPYRGSLESFMFTEHKTHIVFHDRGNRHELTFFFGSEDVMNGDFDLDNFLGDTLCVEVVYPKNRPSIQRVHEVQDEHFARVSSLTVDLETEQNIDDAIETIESMDSLYGNSKVDFYFKWEIDTLYIRAFEFHNIMELGKRAYKFVQSFEATIPQGEGVIKAQSQKKPGEAGDAYVNKIYVYQIPEEGSVNLHEILSISRPVLDEDGHEIKQKKKKKKKEE